MKKSTRNWLLAGGAAAVVIGGGYYLYKRNQPAVPAGQLTAGTPVTTFTNGQKYTIAAPTPQGITTQADLANALISAGWNSTPTILLFNGQGAAPAGFPTQIAANGYIAQGVWGGASGSAVPAGVVAVVSA